MNQLKLAAYKWNTNPSNKTQLHSTIEITTWIRCWAGLPHFTHPNSHHHPIYLSQCSQTIMRSLHWFQMEGGAPGLRFHQVGSLLNSHCSLNVPIKGCEVAILWDNPFLSTLYEPWCVSIGGLHFSYSTALSVCMSLSLFKPKLLHTDSESPVMWYITLQHFAFPQCLWSAITEQTVVGLCSGGQRRWMHLRSSMKWKKIVFETLVVANLR